MSSPTPRQPFEHTPVLQSPLTFAYTQTDAACACRVERTCFKSTSEASKGSQVDRVPGTTQRDRERSDNGTQTLEHARFNRPMLLDGVHLLMSPAGPRATENRHLEKQLKGME